MPRRSCHSKFRCQACKKSQVEYADRISSMSFDVVKQRIRHSWHNSMSLASCGFLGIYCRAIAADDAGLITESRVSCPRLRFLADYSSEKVLKSLFGKNYFLEKFSWKKYFCDFSNQLYDYYYTVLFFAFLNKKNYILSTAFSDRFLKFHFLSQK